MELILASTSRYRQQLLRRLGIDFCSCPPGVDEMRLPAEEAPHMAARLSLAKAREVAAAHPSALVIGSDQVAALDDVVLGKPGTHETAYQQLRSSSGREVRFYTGVALVCHANGYERFHVEPFSVFFRDLSDKSIENYLRREHPYDCAGSFKCEGLGIALFRQLQGNDPTSLEGLPLIALTSMLLEAGVDVLADSTCQR